MKINFLKDDVYFVPKEIDIKYFDYRLDFLEFDKKTQKDIFEVVIEEADVPNNWIDIKKPLEDFLKENNISLEEVWIGNAYGSYCFFVLGKKPEKLIFTGHGFNYGSCNMIEVPKEGKILILAEDD